MKHATVYEREGALYVHSSSQTTVGAWVLNAPVLAPDKEDVAEIGRSVRRCLEASRQGVPHPTNFKNLFKPVLDLAGVKSVNAFMKSAKCVRVQLVDETVALTPIRDEEPKQRCASSPDKTRIALGTDEAVGSAVLAALAMAI